jgi:TonB family protein
MIWNIVQVAILVAALACPIVWVEPAPACAQPREPAAKGELPATPAAVMEAYLQRLADSISKYKFSSQDQDVEGRVSVRFTIARDGQLIDVSIARSSGKPALDSQTLEAFRATAPFSPLPPEIKGESATFTLAFEAHTRRP